MILWGPGTALRTEQIRGSLEAVFLTPASRLVVIFGPVVSQVVWASGCSASWAVVLAVFFGAPIGPARRAARAWRDPRRSARRSMGSARCSPPSSCASARCSAMVQAVRGLFTVILRMSFPIVMPARLGARRGPALPPTYLIADLRGVLLTGQHHQLAPDLAVLFGLGVLSACSPSSPSAGPSATPRRGGRWRSTDDGDAGRGPISPPSGAPRWRSPARSCASRAAIR